MHRCLLVPQLAQRIAEACSSTPYKHAAVSEDHQLPFLGLETLCSLARTCRALQQPVLDVLWCYQSGVQHLVKCLPQDTWNIEWDPFIGCDIIAIRRKLMPNDWDRFDFYAKRVHKFELRYILQSEPLKGYIEIDTSVYEALYARSQPLFPNLQYLSCINADPIPDHPFHRFVRCLVSPALTLLDLGHSQLSKMELIDILSSLPALSPSLKDIKIRVILGDVDMQALSGTLNRLKGLRRLGLTVESFGAHMPSGGDHLFCEGLQQLSILPQLHTLRYDTSKVHIASTHTSNTKSDSCQIKFTLVENIHLGSECSQCLVEALRNVSYPAVQDLTLTWPGTNINDVQRVVALIQSRFSHRALHTLLLGPSPISNNTIMLDADVLPASIFVPLHSFRSLREVTLKSRLCLSISNADLEGFGSAWPRLRSLVIMNTVERLESSHPIVEKPTYKGIASLVKSCPDLKMIHIAIREDIRSVQSFLESGDIPVNAHDVELNFFDSYISDMNTTAQWLARMFPRDTQIFHLIRKVGLGRVHSFGDMLEPSRWTELQSLVDRYHQFRWDNTTVFCIGELELHGNFIPQVLTMTRPDSPTEPVYQDR